MIKNYKNIQVEMEFQMENIYKLIENEIVEQDKTVKGKLSYEKLKNMQQNIVYLQKKF